MNVTDLCKALKISRVTCYERRKDLNAPQAPDLDAWRALAVEIHEEWAEGPRYLDLSVLPAGTGCIARLAEAA